MVIKHNHWYSVALAGKVIRHGALEPVTSIRENSRDKKLSNKCIYDFVCLLYAYDEIVSSPVAKQKRYDELEEFFEGRMIQNKDWFRNNNIITSSYSFVKKVLDSIAGR